MNGLIVGIYGIYLIAVGLRGNGQPLLQEITEDAPAYLPWLLAIIGLGVMAQYEQTRKIVTPFTVLLILNFVLRNFGTIESEMRKIYNMSTTPKTPGASGSW